MRHHGFTLIELLVVIAIIAVLITILVPMLTHARSLARAAVCMGNMRTCSTAAWSYVADYMGFIPVHAGYPNWHDQLELTGFISSAGGVFRCPGSKWTTGVHFGPTFQGSYNYPTPKYHPAWDKIIIQNNWNDCDYVWPVQPGRAWKDPGNSLYISDAWINHTPDPVPTQYPTPEGGMALPSNHTHMIWPGDERETITNGWTRGFADRHLGTNVLFLDGHVVRYETRILDRMKWREPETIWDTW